MKVEIPIERTFLISIFRSTSIEQLNKIISDELKEKKNPVINHMNTCTLLVNEGNVVYTTIAIAWSYQIN
jgi:hypothetical protein